MKKTLIALAVLGASAGVAHAQTNVTVYGQLNPSIDYVKISNGSGAQGNAKYTNINDNASRVGFKGTEELGGGLKAIFQMEAYYNIADEGGFDGARDSWAGLAGSFGSVTLGSHDNVVKRIFSSYDPFPDSIGDYNNIFSNGVGSRNSKSIYYTSPNMGGFTLEANLALDTARNSRDDATQVAKYSVGGDYTNGPLKVTAAYGKQENENANDKLYRLGAAFTLPTKTVLSVVYDKRSGATDRKAAMLGVQHPINNIDLIGTFIYADDTNNVANTGAKNINLGARYNFSKRTNVAAQYTWLKNDTAGTYGMDAGYGKATVADPTAGIGEDGRGSRFNAFSVRLQHKF